MNGQSSVNNTGAGRKVSMGISGIWLAKCDKCYVISLYRIILRLTAEKLNYCKSLCYIYRCCMCVMVSFKNNVTYEAKCDIIEEAGGALYCDATFVCQISK